MRLGGNTFYQIDHVTSKVLLILYFLTLWLNHLYILLVFYTY